MRKTKETKLPASFYESVDIVEDMTILLLFTDFC